MLTWNVFYADFNNKCIVTKNVFDNTRLLEDCVKNAKKNKDDKAAFAEQLRRDLMYYYWCKCEWEVILQSWPPRDDFNDKKIDIFWQTYLNWDVFVDYVWSNKDFLLGKKVAKQHKK